MSVDDLVTAGERDRLRQVNEHVILAGEAATLEIDIVTDDGPPPLELSVAPWLDEHGRSRGTVLVGRPVGDVRIAYAEFEISHIALQEAQSHPVRSEKLTSLGRPVAGVAHALNNPISFVYAPTHVLEKYTSHFETVHQHQFCMYNRPPNSCQRAAP